MSYEIISLSQFNMDKKLEIKALAQFPNIIWQFHLELPIVKINKQSYLDTINQSIYG